MKIGYIGLGAMGRHMATNLQRAGHALIVHDLNKSAAQPHIDNGAIWADSPGQLAAQCEVIFTSLPGPKEIQAAYTGENGLVSGLRTGAVIFDLSTNAPRLAREMHQLLGAKGVSLLDAPVSGGPKGSESGKLAIWVSGDEKLFEKYRPILGVMGNDIQYLGDIGAASVAKLVHNSIHYAINATIAEIFTMGVKAGVDPASLFKALRSGASGRRRTFDLLPAHFLNNKYDPASFALRLAHKDVTLATELAKDIGVAMPITDITLSDMTEALEKGWENRDSRSPMLLPQERAGINVQCDSALIQAIMDE